MKYVITFYSNFDDAARVVVVKSANNMIHAIQLCEWDGYNIDCIVAITEVD